jgi:hypothetical protein
MAKGQRAKSEHSASVSYLAIWPFGYKFRSPRSKSRIALLFFIR